MGDVQPALGLLATAVLNTAFAVAAGCLTSLWTLRRTNSPWSRSKIDSLVVALRTSLVICGLAFALLLWTEAAAMSEVPLLSAGGAIGDVLAHTHFGHAWILGSAALLVLASISNLREHWLGPSRLMTAVGCALLFAASKSWMSHAGSSGQLLPFVIDWVHLVSVSIWAGAVFVATAVVLRRPHPVGLGERSACAAFVEYLSAVATWSLVAVLVTGAFSAWRGLGGSTQALFSSTYGQILLAKLVLVALAVALGAHNRFVGMPPLLNGLRLPQSSSPGPQQAFYRVLFLESVVLVAVLVAAADLSTSAPPST